MKRIIKLKLKNMKHKNRQNLLKKSRKYKINREDINNQYKVKLNKDKKHLVKLNQAFNNRETDKSNKQLKILFKNS